MKEEKYETNIRKVELKSPIWTGFLLTIGMVIALIIFFSVYRMTLVAEYVLIWYASDEFRDKGEMLDFVSFVRWLRAYQKR